MRAARLVAIALVLGAGTAGAQDEPPATWYPQAAKPPPSPPAPREPPPSGTSTESAPSPRPAPPAQPGGEGVGDPSTSVESAPSPRPAPPAHAGSEGVGEPAPRPRAGSYRWQLLASAGPAAEGAPGLLVGAGVALGAVAETRLHLNVLLGWSAATQHVPVQASWNDATWTFTSADTSARAFLFELTGSRRVGAVDLWAGGGIHVSMPQLEATYEVTRCTDLLCLGPTYRTTDTDAQVGSGAPGLLLSAGARLPVHERFLVGLDVRWLAPATSRVEERYALAIRTGGFAVSAGLAVRLGARLPH